MRAVEHVGAAKRDEALAIRDVAPGEPEPRGILARHDAPRDDRDARIAVERRPRRRLRAGVEARVVVQEQHDVGPARERALHADVGAAGEAAVLGQPHDVGIRRALREEIADRLVRAVVHDDDVIRRLGGQARRGTRASRRGPASVR
jgi:hypothetical protein